ncbi:MAG: hypothetical protein AAGA03_02500, partial [Planctomycetota bacterium]
GGCRGRAHEDLYQQKLTQEIRFLEDQLYEADYENRVLAEKLEREKLKSEDADKYAPLIQQERTPPNGLPAFPTPRPDTVPNAGTDSSADVTDPMDLDDEALLELPLVDPGSPIDEVPAPATNTPSTADGSAESADPGTEPSRSQTPNPITDDLELSLPPMAPEPPGASDTEAPQVVPGTPVPPGNPGGVEAVPPGQVELPAPLGMLPQNDTDRASSRSAKPVAIEIHPSLSETTQPIDAEGPTGLRIVVTAVDAFQRMVDLSEFDIDADLAVVVIDPTQAPGSSRIARRDFTSVEAASLLRDSPLSGLFVPVNWDTPPAGDEVEVHVRLTAGQQVMQCKRTLAVGPTASVSQWTPRGRDDTKTKR